MKTLFNIAKYTLAGYGLLVLIGNLQKVAAKSSGENPEENHISEPELKDVKLYGSTDDNTLKIYATINALIKEHGRMSYSDVNRIVEKYSVCLKFLEESDDIGWDRTNFNPIAQYDADIGFVVIYLPKAKKLA